MKYLPFVLIVFASFGCGNEDDNGGSFGPNTPTTPNLLLIIADDLGKDAFAGYAEGNFKANTPNLDALRSAGLTFNNFWSYPTCSPTRASIITGKYGYRTGVKWANDALGDNEEILHQYIKEQTDDTYSTALIGKWHLSGEATAVNPEDFGMDYYAGLLRGAAQDYYNWRLTEDGQGSLNTNYITEVFTDLAIDWINVQSNPWFLWLAYNAPHTPFHVPPSNMHTQGALVDYVEGADATPYYLAAIEAMDFQLGRLIEAIPSEDLANTTIIFMGDNGTPNQVAQTPYSNNKAKGTLFQGGVNVPMFISGASVSRIGSEDQLVSSPDLFATIASLAGANTPRINDSKNFAGLLTEQGQGSDFQYAELENDTQEAWAISNGEYKLIVSADGTEQLYSLSQDPYETDDLLEGSLNVEATEAKSILENELARIRD